MDTIWENSRAKVVLQCLLENKLDKNEDGTNQRANVIYKKWKHEFSEFQQPFFTKQLQKLRKCKVKEPKEPDFEEVVSVEELEEEWENSSAKTALGRLVEEGKDKNDKGNNQRADTVFKMMDGAFKHFPLKFFVTKLQALRKGKKEKNSAEDSELKERWENSRAKVVLGRIVEHGFDCKDDGNNKTSKEVYGMNEDFKLFPQPWLTEQLKILRKGKPKIPSWKNSLGRSILEEVILVGLDRDDDGNDLPVLTIYEMVEEFQKFPLKRFSVNLEALRVIVHEVADKALRDSVAVDEFLARNTQSTMDAPRFNYARYPKWQGSEAQRLLRIDLKGLLQEDRLFKGKDGVLPKDLWETRDEYEAYPLIIFRNHIYKEIIHDKQVNWNQHKKKKQRLELRT
jgi:hypothetical protein